MLPKNAFDYAKILVSISAARPPVLQGYRATLLPLDVSLEWSARTPLRAANTLSVSMDADGMCAPRAVHNDCQR